MISVNASLLSSAHRARPGLRCDTPLIALKRWVTLSSGDAVEGREVLERGVRVPERRDDAHLRERGGDLAAAFDLGREGHDPHAPFRETGEPLEVRGGERLDHRLGNAPPPRGIDVRTLDVDARDPAREIVLRGHGLEGRAERADIRLVGDRRGHEGSHALGREVPRHVPQAVRRRVLGGRPRAPVDVRFPERGAHEQAGRVDHREAPRRTRRARPVRRPRVPDGSLVHEHHAGPDDPVGQDHVPALDEETRTLGPGTHLCTIE